MRRREFITLWGSAAAWPIAAMAQQDHVRRLGVLRGANASDPDAQSDVAAFESAFRDLGWALGRNVIIDYRWSGGDAERARALAKELLKTSPDAVIAVGTAAITAFQGQTDTVPIVFARISDPVGKGFVTNLARPRGNITGFSNFEFAMGGIWLETLKML